jgi:hypothetical protein
MSVRLRDSSVAALVGEVNITNLYTGFKVNLTGTVNVVEAARFAACAG